MWFWVLSLGVSLWVLFDARARKINGVPWAVGTFLLMALALPFYFAKRPLKVGEVREGGTAWNVLRNFAILWTVIMAIAAVAGLANAGSTIDSLDSDAARAGAGIGIVLSMGLIGAFWFFPMVGAVVLGFILKKNSVVERGPSGPLADSLSEGAAVRVDSSGVDAEMAAEQVTRSRMPRVLLAVGGVFVALVIIGALLPSTPSQSDETAPARTRQSSVVRTSSTPSESNITMSQFLRLQNGMSYREVVEILGRPGEEMSRSDIAGLTTVMYTWSNPVGFSNMNAMFQDDRLVSKAQLGLK